MKFCLVTIIVFLLSYSNSIGHGQIQLMSLMDPWTHRIKNILRNFRRLELDTLHFRLPFEDKNITRVQFHLYTDRNPIRSQLLQFNNSFTVENSNYNKELPLKMLIHGYSQHKGSADFPQQIKDAYMKMATTDSKNYNIICVDWSILSKEINYFDSANYTMFVGKYVGDFLLDLKSTGIISNFSNVHLIGFSLGAHVSGVAGHHIIQETRGTEKIGRITGLDPAQPGFSSAPMMHRLDSQDATFVDIIHTNMGHLLFGDLGIMSNSGHADFFPNGGRRQPDCNLSVFTEYSIPRRSTCSHVKAADYFRKSILGERYISCQCKDWNSFRSGLCDCGGSEIIMGEYCDHLARGEFYLSAN